jgi:hypothetical protein
MKYAVEMGSGSMIHVQSFIKIVQALKRDSGGFTDTQTTW